MSPSLLREAELFLRDRDPVLGTLFDTYTIRLRPRRDDYFASLCRSIIGQQVSVAAAAAIAARFETVTKLDPEAVANLGDDDIKTIGLSRQKAGYLRDLGAHFAADPALYDHLELLDDEAVIEELVRVKGIGVWTAQMFLMFTLTRPDVFAPDDVGLQNGMMKLYGWDSLPKKKELAAIAEQWSPYRSVASLLLWESLDNAPA